MEIIEDKKNNFLRLKYPFTKTVVEGCHLLAKWKNQYGVNLTTGVSRMTVLFLKVSDEKEEKIQQKDYVLQV